MITIAGNYLDGTAQYALRNQQVLLDGTASGSPADDAGDEIVSFLWSFDELPPGTAVASNVVLTVAVSEDPSCNNTFTALDLEPGDVQWLSGAGHQPVRSPPDLWAPGAASHAGPRPDPAQFF